jgi:hypothetical protein
MAIKRNSKKILIPYKIIALVKILDSNLLVRNIAIAVKV